MHRSAEWLKYRREQDALVLVVDRTHQLRRWWKDLVDEDEDGLLWCELNPFPDYVHELADGEVLSNGAIGVSITA